MARRVTFKGRPGVGPSSKPQTTLWRCGVQHSADGADFEADAFSEEEWARLEADPLLTVEDADSSELTRLSEDDLSALADLIEGLPEDAFGKSGAPKLDALRAAWSGDGSALTSAERDEAWKIVLERLQS